MLRSLSAEQVEGYRNNGFVCPVPALSEAEIDALMQSFARYESWLGEPLSKAPLRMRGATHIYLPWMYELCTNSKILDAVEDLIGPDILVYFSTIFLKEPRSNTITAWHQDGAYFGLTPHEHVTAWVALTDATAAAGCMEAISFQGSPRMLRHAQVAYENNLNTRGQTIVDPIDESNPVALALNAGSFSLHHTLCPHRSQTNSTDNRRIGIGVSYMPTHCKHAGMKRQAALLVRGEDRYGNFDLLSAPRGECNPADIAIHTQVQLDFRANYEVAVRAHEEAAILS